MAIGVVATQLSTGLCTDSPKLLGVFFELSTDCFTASFGLSLSEAHARHTIKVI